MNQIIRLYTSPGSQLGTTCFYIGKLKINVELNPFAKLLATFEIKAANVKKLDQAVLNDLTELGYKPDKERETSLGWYWYCLNSELTALLREKKFSALPRTSALILREIEEPVMVPSPETTCFEWFTYLLGEFEKKEAPKATLGQFLEKIESNDLDGFADLMGDYDSLYRSFIFQGLVQISGKDYDYFMKKWFNHDDDVK